MGAVSSSLYKGHRDPAEIISHCVWWYHRFPLSFQEVEEMMMARGVIVSYETIRGWCRKFGFGAYCCSRGSDFMVVWVGVGRVRLG